MIKQATLIFTQHYHTKNMMKSDPVITYNHMDDDDANRKMKHNLTGRMLYITEVIIIAALLAFMFIMF
jgi:hypothetical protein